MLLVQNDNVLCLRHREEKKNERLYANDGHNGNFLSVLRSLITYHLPLTCQTRFLSEYESRHWDCIMGCVSADSEKKNTSACCWIVVQPITCISGKFRHSSQRRSDDVYGYSFIHYYIRPSKQFPQYFVGFWLQKANKHRLYR